MHMRCHVLALADWFLRVGLQLCARVNSAASVRAVVSKLSQRSQKSSPRSSDCTQMLWPGMTHVTLRGGSAWLGRDRLTAAAAAAASAGRNSSTLRMTVRESSAACTNPRMMAASHGVAGASCCAKACMYGMILCAMRWAVATGEQQRKRLLVRCAARK